MTNFNMSKLWLGKDGYYRDVNGNKIAQKGQAISGAAWRYLASKYGRDYANRTSMNTRNGNIFQNGRWRFNDVESSKQGKLLHGMKQPLELKRMLKLLELGRRHLDMYSKINLMEKSGFLTRILRIKYNRLS